MRKIRYAVIGIGNIGKLHAEIAKKNELIELIAIAELNEEVGKSFSQKLGVKWYQDYVDMLEKEELDAVSICTPHFLHHQMCINAARHGVNVLVEKPMAITVKEADEMIYEAKKNSVKLGVVFQLRFDKEFQILKRIIDEGLGELLHTSLFYGCYRTQQYYGTASWRGKWKYEGSGVLINQAIHFIDLMQWLIGKLPRKIYAITDTLMHKIEVEDVATALLEYDNRARGVIYASNYHFPHEEGITILGENMHVKINSKEVTIQEFAPSLREALFTYSKENPWGIKPEITERIIKRTTVFGVGHKYVLKDFAQAIIEDREPMVTGEEGRKSLEMINAIIMSSMLGKAIQIPIDPEEYDEIIRRLSYSQSQTNCEQII